MNFMESFTDWYEEWYIKNFKITADLFFKFHWFLRFPKILKPTILLQKQII